MTIWTAGFAAQDAVIASGAAPIAVSRYLPRFPLRYEIAEHLTLLAPTSQMLRELRGQPERFATTYLKRLDQLGSARIIGELARLRGEHGDLVLLCFEPRGQPCHRCYFAVWWALHTGESVPELPPVPDLPENGSHSPAQLSLFGRPR